MVIAILLNTVLMSVMVPSSLVNGHSATVILLRTLLLSVIILGVILMSAVAPF